MDTPDLARMRQEYSDAGLDESVLDGAGVGDDPVALVQRWLAEAIAAGVHEPNAMALATATLDGRPSVRIVLLKGFDERGLVFFTGYESRKGRELEANPHAAATLLWHELQRQVRIEGTVTRVTPEESDAYFASRPRGSQVSAAASPQSEPVADRAELDRLRDEVEQRFDGVDVERPEEWGGFRIALDSIELWQGRRSRFHDRLRFTFAGDGWVRERLAP